MSQQYNQYFSSHSQVTKYQTGMVKARVIEPVRVQHFDDRGHYIMGTEFNDTIISGAGNDMIIDRWGKNTIHAGAGDDYIIAAGTIEGGQGNDRIEVVHNGNKNTVIFNIGDGQDMIKTVYAPNQPMKGEDRLVFGEGITAEMISFKRDQFDMIVVIGDSGDEIRFSHYFYSHQSLAQTFNRFEFADGTVWEDIRTRPFVMRESHHGVMWGTPYSDEIYGSEGNDTIIDLEGSHNVINAGAGHDTINARGAIRGGRGHDTITTTINGSADTLYFGLGDGQDTIRSFDKTEGYDTRDQIVFDEGITVEMIAYARQGKDLIITVGENGDQMQFAGYFSANNARTFNRLVFADGTIVADIRETSAVKNMLQQSNSIGRSLVPSVADYENQANYLISAMSCFAVEGANTALSLNDAHTQYPANMLALNEIG